MRNVCFPSMEQEVSECYGLKNSAERTLRSFLKEQIDDSVTSCRHLRHHVGMYHDQPFPSCLISSDMILYSVSVFLELKKSSLFQGNLMRMSIIFDIVPGHN